MTARRRCGWGDEAGFTIVEAMMASTLLAIAIVLTIAPMLSALRSISDARMIAVAENLAQAEIESIRALDYDNIGSPGRTPSGVLDASREVTVDNRTYLIEVSVLYAGSVTGLNVIPQGGDGVEGSWDPGVDYKTVTVTVTGETREMDPVVMETIVSPPRLGAHEGIANARVAVVRHEPFASSTESLPTVKITASPGSPIHSVQAADVQVFPAIPSGNYVVSLNDANGWVIHPGDIAVQADRLTVTAGSTTDASIRVFRPASLQLTSVTDFYSGASIGSARLTITRLSDSVVIVGSVGQYTLSGLVPDTYDVRISATGYHDLNLTSINVPVGYPADLSHEMSVVLQPLVPPTTTTTTIPGASTTTTTVVGTTTTTLPANTVTVQFTVTDNTGMVVAGATITINHPTRGLLTSVTDAYGRTTINLEKGRTYTSTASTPWGHGSDDESFNPTNNTNINHKLKRPNNMGTMKLTGGNRAELLFKSVGSWTAMPANYQGEASFVAFAGNYDVAKRCLANSAVLGQKNVSVRAGRNREASISGNCP